MKLPKFTVGMNVYDGPSKLDATVISVTKTEGAYYYTLDDSIPLNATGDGAFPNRTRCEHEICLQHDAATFQFSY